MAGAPLAIAIGAAAGILSGVFGIGGGIVLTPAVRLALERPELVAIGTSLPVIVPGAVAGALVHASRGRVVLAPGVHIGAWGVLSSTLGAWFATFIGGQVVLIALSAIMFLVALDVASGALRGRIAGRTAGDRSRMVAESGAVAQLTQWRRAKLGVLTGLFSGTFGLGGGLLLVPMLIRAGVSMHQAIPTSLVAIAFIALPGSLAHWALGNVDAGLAMLLIAGIVPGALIGSRISLGSSEPALRLAFSALLALTGIALAAGELGLGGVR